MKGKTDNRRTKESDKRYRESKLWSDQNKQKVVEITEIPELIQPNTMYIVVSKINENI